MTHLKALIFDVDGTLAETERDGHRVAFNRAFAEAGLEWFWDEQLYAQLLAVTGGKERIRYYLEKFSADKIAEAELDRLIQHLHQTKTRFYTDILHSGVIPLRPGVKRLIAEAQNADIRLAIATTTTPANVDALLTSTMGDDALSIFEVIAAGDVVPAKKPAADIFHYCLDNLNLQARDCLAIEDSGHGLTASFACGVPTVVTVNGYTENEDFTGALSVFNHLGEPDLPCQCLAGQTIVHSFVTIEDLKGLHEQASR